MNHLDWRGVEGLEYRRLKSSETKPLASVPGSAISGVITAVGEGFQKHSKLKVGQEVIGICNPRYLDSSLISTSVSRLIGRLKGECLGSRKDI